MSDLLFLVIKRGTVGFSVHLATCYRDSLPGTVVSFVLCGNHF